LCHIRCNRRVRAERKRNGGNAGGCGTARAIVPRQMPRDIDAKYANCFRVGYSEFELVIDFAQCSSEGDAPPHTRIVVVPVYAIELARLLEKSLDDYRQQYGSLPELS